MRRLRFIVLTALMGAVVAGCSSDDEAGPEPEDVPGVPVSAEERAPMSAEEFESGGHLEDHLETVQAHHRWLGWEDFPEVEIVRVVGPEEQADVWVACMTEAGYAVSVTFDGGLAPPQNMPDDQWDAYHLANYTCFVQFPVDYTMDYFGQEQIEVTYAYYVDVLIPCLEDRGITVSEPPTVESFRSSWVSDGRGGYYASEDLWFPYASVDADTMSFEAWESLNRACPQAAPEELLYPDG